LLTGRPGCGKTTLVQRVIEKLQRLRLAGFYTQEIRAAGRRLGFEAVGMGGTSTVLAHADFKTGMHVGRYGVDLRGFDPLIRRELEKSAGEVDLFVIDEIGRMECFSGTFVECVTGALDGTVPVLATIAFKGGGFMKRVKARRDVELLTVSSDNRDSLAKELSERFGES
jgi:nucleoside-triphosphatase